MSTLSSWSDLPIELLSMIAKCLETRMDKTRFRSVCNSWRSSTPSFPNRHRQFSIRYPDMHPNSNFDQTPEYFHTTFQTLYCLEPLTQPSSTSINQKWLVVVEEFEHGKVRLLNPFTGKRINPLPSGFRKELNLLNFRVVELQSLYRLEGEESLIIQKVVLLPNSTSDEPLIVVLKYTGNLSFFKFVENEWILIHEIANGTYFVDIVSYKGKIYAITDNEGQAIIVDSSLNVTTIAQLNSEGVKGTHYFVVSSEGLYAVERSERGHLELIYLDKINKHKMETKVDVGNPFKIYKLDLDENKWNAVTHLDGHILVLGDEVDPYWGLFVSSHQIPGCNGNCIFFTDYFRTREGYKNMYGVFDMETGRCGLLEQFPSYADMFWPPPNWVVGVSSE